jgi:hypothetical protein
MDASRMGILVTQQRHANAEDEARGDHDLEADDEPGKRDRQALLFEERLRCGHAAVSDFEPPVGDPEARENEAQQSRADVVGRRQAEVLKLLSPAF